MAGCPRVRKLCTGPRRRRASGGQSWLGSAREQRQRRILTRAKSTAERHSRSPPPFHHEQCSIRMDRGGGRAVVWCVCAHAIHSCRRAKPPSRFSACMGFVFIFLSVRSGLILLTFSPSLLDARDREDLKSAPLPGSPRFLY